MCAATPRMMRSVSARSAWVTATVPKSWSWTPTRPPRRVTRAISATTRSGSATCRITVIASTASKRPPLNGSAAPSASRSVTRLRAPRHRFRASRRIRRLGSTPTTLPRGPAIAARSRMTTPVPQPTSRIASPGRMGTKRRNRPRRRAWVGVRPRSSSEAASFAASGCASTSRHGSGWSEGAVTKRASAAGGAASAFGAAEVTDLSVLQPAQRPCLHDVGVAHEAFHELIGELDTRAERSLREPAQQRSQQRQRDRQREENQHDPHRVSAIWLDGDRAEELPVLGGELRRDGAARPLASEEDARVRAATEDLLNGVTRGLGRGERGLDGVEELSEEWIGPAFSPHRAPYDTIPTRWPPAGRASDPPRGTRVASSRSVKTPGACPTVSTSSTPSSTWA